MIMLACLHNFLQTASSVAIAKTLHFIVKLNFHIFRKSLTVMAFEILTFDLTSAIASTGIQY